MPHKKTADRSEVEANIVPIWPCGVQWRRGRLADAVFVRKRRGNTSSPCARGTSCFSQTPRNAVARGLATVYLGGDEAADAGDVRLEEAEERGAQAIKQRCRDREHQPDQRLDDA